MSGDVKAYDADNEIGREGFLQNLLRLWLDQYDWRPLCLSQLQKPEQLP
jgi:hypothetical protein